MVALVTTVSCDRYMVTKDAEGRTVRLNKSSGEVVIIDGDRMIIPKNSREVEAEKKQQVETLRSQKEKLAMRRDWDTSKVLKSNVSLSTIYLGNQMRFRLTFDKKPERWEDNSFVKRPFTLIFLKSGIEVFTKPLDREKFIGLFTNGQEAGLQCDGSVDMTSEEYEMLGGWNLMWSI